MLKIIIFLLVAFGLIQPISTAYFHLFQNINHGGEPREMHCFDYNCHEIGAGFNDRTSSINTHGGCVALFEHSNCRGRRVIFKPGCELGECCKHNNFRSCGFNDEASSYACC
uniref:Uncharacterized protein n=1 Tax=Panagrolaimus sp. JU765 TaxID=591449 RepID=A0AC34QGD4_9BILA